MNAAKDPARVASGRKGGVKGGRALLDRYGPEYFQRIGAIGRRRVADGCKVDGCDRPHKARGWCSTHYDYWRKTGQEPTRQPTDLEYVMARIDPDGDCWIWTGTVLSNGYGQVRRQGRGMPAHRFVYKLLVGPIPDGKQLDHLCRRRACVNPDHLEPVTGRENKLRGDTVNARNARKTACLRGHPLRGDNLIICSDGARACRTCRREVRHARYLRDRARRRPEHVAQVERAVDRLAQAAGLPEGSAA